MIDFANAPGHFLISFTVGISLLTLAGLLYAKRRRMFGRMRRGFAFALATTFVVVGLTTSAVLGVWAYVSARQVVLIDFAERLHAVGRVAEGDVTHEIAVLTTRLAHLADRDLLENSLHHPDVAHAELAAVQKWNPRLLQFQVCDRDGRVVLSTTAQGDSESLNRVGIAFALEGKVFVSEPYRANSFGRHLLYLSIPICDAQQKPIGALTLRYDLEEELEATFAAHEFGQTFDTILVAGDGTIMAHHDGHDIGTSFSASPIFAAAQAEATGTLLVGSSAGPMLTGYRRVSNPATLGGKPMLLVTEISYDEVMAEVHLLRLHLLIGAAALAVFWLMLAGAVATLVTRPLAKLVTAAEQVRGGDFTVQVPLSGRDEIGQFAQSFNQMVHGLAERDRVKQLFGRYLTTQVSEKILKGDANIGGQRKRVTIMFADIRDFTTISEKLSPEQVVEMLNEYFTEMVDAVFEFGGVLDKFIGDGMMAVFGSIDDQPDHARRAVQCGLRMKARLAKINGERESRGEPPIAIGIGIHTDEVVVGNIGSRRRLEYTVIGDGVNTCSRVEAMNKQLQTTLLITEQTRRELGDDFTVAAKPECAAKGKSKPVKVFEVISRSSAMARAA